MLGRVWIGLIARKGKNDILVIFCECGYGFVRYMAVKFIYGCKLSVFVRDGCGLLVSVCWVW